MRSGLSRLVGVGTLCAFGSAVVHAASVGHTVGSFAVSPTGAATYSIPLWVPPGTHGMQPHLALVYDSQSGDSTLGFGWNLAGLSAITRCRNTLAQDGAASPIALAAGDRYCMNGQRLRLTSSETLSTYGNANTTYQTEVADFSNVTASPTTTGNGPSYFTVKGKNGLTYEYGNPVTTYSGGPANNGSQIIPSGSSTVSMWLLDKVTDRAGNNYVITYSAPNSATGVGLPSVIVYTPASAGSTSYKYSVTFAYGTRVAQNAATHDTAQTGYVASTSFFNPNLLNGITIAYSGTTVHQYNFGYTASATTTRALLTTITECAGSAGNDCYPATNITYQAGSAGVTSTAATAVTGSNLQVIAARDFNGDGLDDILYINTSTNALSVAFATTTGFGAPVSVATFTGGTLYQQIAYGDLLGLGYYDIVLPVSGIWNRYHWNGTSFVASSTGVSVDSGATQAGLQDVNGDGLADLITVVPVGDGTVTIYARRNSSSGTTVSFTSAIATNAFSDCSGDTCSQKVFMNGGLAARAKSLDFNADGRADIAVVTSNTTGHAVIFTSSEFLSTSTPTTISFQQVSGGGTWTPSFLNTNDDGCTDYADGAVSSPGYMHFSPCNGLPGASASTAYYPVGAIDWDSDGRDDILVQNGSSLGVIESTGNGLTTSLITTSLPLNNYNLFVFDKDGDGQGDIGVWTASTISYYRHNSPGAPPDLVASITDGYGNSVAPSYAPLTIQGNVYLNFSDAISGYVNYIGPMYVASQAVFSDPTSTTGGTYSHTYSYYGAWMNLQGRGFTGFNDIGDLDSRNNLWHVAYYRRDFPYIGLPPGDQLWRPTSPTMIPVQKTTYTLSSLTLDSTTNNQRYFPYVAGATTLAYEYGGSIDGQLISTTTTSYSTPDSYGNSTTVTKQVTDNDSTSPYLGDSWTTTTTNTWSEDAAHWCLSLLSQTQVAYTASIGSPVTRTKSFTPDTTNCRYTQIVTEPSSPTYKVTEALAYDSFGNVSSDSVTGINMTARPTTITWSNGTYTTGQFPLSVQDPSGATTQFTYNYSYGEIASLTDPNSTVQNPVVTQWQYDNFGRKTQETRPDGTAITWTYADCAVNNYCPRGTHMLITAKAVDTGGNYITDVQTYPDPIDRPIMQFTRTINTSSYYSFEDWQYDSLGRLVRHGIPCLTAVCNAAQSITSSYDALNRLTQVQRPISSTNSTLQTTTYGYAGRTQTLTDPYNNTRTLVTDVNGWQRQTKDAYGYTVTTSYNAAGSSTGITDSAGHTLLSGVTWAYGVTPFLTASTDVDLGAWSYTVDALGERTAWTDAKGKHFSETYDALSRPLTRSEPDYFTRWTWGASAASHNIGKLASVCTGLGTNPIACTTSGYSENETYDALSRPLTRAIVIPSDGTFTYTWGYSSTTGLPSTLTYPTSTSGYALQLQYGYSYGVLTSIKTISDTPNITLWTANATDAFGHVTQETLGNGIVTNRTYDGVTSWLGSLTSGVGGGAGVKNLGWLYDEMGNATQRQDNNLGLTENFYYDNDYRLTSSKLNNVQNLAIGYDNTMGNITSRSDVAGGASWTYDTVKVHAVRQAGSSAYTYTYDANGNAITRNGSTVNWNAANYPTSIASGSESVAFSYGPDRQRWQQNYNSGTETTNYIGNLLEKVFSGGTVTYRHYVYAGNSPVAVYARNATTGNAWSYFVSDHQGSVAAVTNSSGGVVINESFTATGARRNPSTWSGAPSGSDLNTIAGVSRQGYTWQTALGQSTGLNHMKGRVQDAITGRFLSADPNIPDPTNPQSYNRYSYVVNNPLTFTDPSGFRPVCFTVSGYFTYTTIVDTPEGDTPQEVQINSSRYSYMSCLDSLPDQPGDHPGGPGRGGDGTPDQTPPPANPPPKQPPRNNPPQTNPNQPCHSSWIYSSGKDLINMGQTLRNWGNSTAQAGANLALVSAVASAVGVPAEPGIVVGGGMAAVGAVMNMEGSVSQFIGGVMSSNSEQAGTGFLSALQNLIEDTAFSLSERFGLPGLPSFIPDPLDSAVEAGSKAPEGVTCH